MPRSAATLAALDVSRRDRGKVRWAKVKMRENVEKKRYNARDWAGYSATLDAAGVAALNSRASRNGALHLDVRRRDMGKLCGAAVSRRARGGARLCM